MAYFKNWPILKNGLFQYFCRRHNYRKRDVFFEKKNATTFGNALYCIVYTLKNNSLKNENNKRNKKTCRYFPNC